MPIAGASTKPAARPAITKATEVAIVKRRVNMKFLPYLLRSQPGLWVDRLSVVTQLKVEGRIPVGQPPHIPHRLARCEGTANIGVDVPQSRDQAMISIGVFDYQDLAVPPELAGEHDPAGPGRHHHGIGPGLDRDTVVAGAKIRLRAVG